MSRSFPLLLSFSLLAAITGCGGGGGGAGSEETANDGSPAPASVALSGQILPAADTAVDRTLNDPRDAVGENSACQPAQFLEASTIVYGFATATGTGGDPDQQQYADSANAHDFYRVSLSAGEGAELEVADYQAGVNELDLYLWNSDCSQVLASSTDGGELEQVVSHSGGEAVVEVRAHAGTSKYVVRTASSWDGSYSVEEMEILSGEIAPFAVDEVVLELVAGADAAAYDALSEALRQAHGVELQYRHQDPERATLATLVPVGGGSVNPPELLNDLRNLSQQAYDIFNTLRLVEFLEQQPQVAQAEPNFLMAPAALEPNDPLYDSQWHYQNIALPDAWATTTGARADGQPVIVAVLDTGVFQSHEDLQGKLLPGHDFHDGDTDPEDSGNWHGTHVAGTAAASTDNSTGVAGVSWNASILPVRVIGSDGGSSYAVMQGVRYAAGLTNDSGTTPERPADVINLSLGSSGNSLIAQDLYRQVQDKGIFAVAAAGNDGSDEPYYPAAYDTVLSVSATDCSNNLASYSNYGPTIDLAAPGGDTMGCGILSNGGIRSTLGGDSASGTYGWLMGTSMASPHVAGVIALMRAEYPELTPGQFNDLLTEGLITKGEPGRDDSFGHGLINAAKAVQEAESLSNASTPPPAEIVAQPAALYLEQASEASLELRQRGDGEPPAVTGWQVGAAWLTVVESTVDQRGLGTYRIEIDRTGFEEADHGTHRSAVNFQLDNGDALRVPVSIQVGYASEAAPIYVLLLDPETLEVAYQTRAHWTDASELRYTFEGVAAGSYRLRAGSDTDADRLVCQRGEICGAYRAFDQPETVSVEDESISGLDFSVDLLSRFRSTGDSADPVQRD